MRHLVFNLIGLHTCISAPIIFHTVKLHPLRTVFQSGMMHAYTAIDAQNLGQFQVEAKNMATQCRHPVKSSCHNNPWLGSKATTELLLLLSMFYVSAMFLWQKVHGGRGQPVKALQLQSVTENADDAKAVAPWSSLRDSAQHSVVHSVLVQCMAILQPQLRPASGPV